MRIVTEVKGDLTKIIDGEIKAGRLAGLAAVSGIGASIKANWRDQVSGARLGGRLANTVRYEVYPKGRGSLNAAALIYTRAPKILGAFETGVEIRAKGGRWLAIPLPAAGLGKGGKRMTPGEWERRRGIRLRFVYRPNNKALLVADGRLNKRGLGVESRSRTGRGRATVPIFLLVPRVRLQKRLGLVSSAERLAGRMGAALVANWRS